MARPSFRRGPSRFTLLKAGGLCRICRERVCGERARGGLRAVQEGNERERLEQLVNALALERQRRVEGGAGQAR
jgi:hypothetical protein